MRRLADLMRSIQDLVKVASANPRGTHAVMRLILAVALLATLPSLLMIIMMLAG